MSVDERSDYQAVLEKIDGWSRDERLALAYEILQSVASTRERRPTLPESLGLLRSDKEPPTDEEVRQWLEERHMERHG